jgi:hypothetical protein
MREKVYVDTLSGVLDRDPETRRAVVDTFTADLPAGARQRLAVPLWAWTCDGPPACDLVLGDSTDLVRCFLEFKGLYTSANWMSLASVRHLEFGADSTAQKIRRHYLTGTDPVLDSPHGDADCARQPCRYWKKAKHRPELHYPVIHQGDAYRATLPGVSNMTRPGNLGEVVYMLIAPHPAQVTDWRDGLISREDWHIVWLVDVLDRLRDLAPGFPAAQSLVTATETFLNLGHR